MAAVRGRKLWATQPRQFRAASWTPTNSKSHCCVSKHCSEVVSANLNPPPPSLVCAFDAELYAWAEIRRNGWGKKQKDEWRQRQEHREAAYKKRYSNLVSTCQYTATGRKRGPITSVFELAASNPKVFKPGEVVAKNRMSSLSRKQARARKKVAKSIRKGDKSSNTGYKQRSNKM